ncbi:QueT transporter family protein [Vagococcus elongatus]|uniref:QueT transporter family protein n=1 Tax=Vagococcus elongatus TaxID=180344 RepID=A0A430B228_9ENTE|nr:QueT transporter family protein [Vagococcus elongatus]RSU14384.1 hypothetical protein CBF29_03545 [Vagococcus elongatus]
MQNKKTKGLLINGIVAAMYLVLTILVSPVASGPIQFRISESLNHLVVFNKKLIWGVFFGVVLYNLMFSEFGMLDVIFGGGQTLAALLITSFLKKYIKDVRWLLAANVLVFSISMGLIAWMLYVTIQAPFWLTYGWTALSEFIVMGIAAPVMYYISSRINLDF